MKKRKLFSTVVTGALIAAQMTMSVMAATGSVNTDVTTKNAVIRVQVPTKLGVAVDEFETAGDGSQIYSEEFGIKNFSTVPVHVSTESVVVVGTDVTLKATKDEVVEDAAKKGNAWLAVAAKTAADKYGSGTIADLTETSSNVTTVNPADGKSKQEFYLDKGTGNVEYKLQIADTDVPSYAEFYELTEDTTITDDTKLATALKASDIYVVASADATTNGANVSKLEKDSTATYAGTNKYYKAATTASVPAASKNYVYAGQTTVGGEAGFRFVGKLSTGKSGGWTKNDFTSITINYDITGVQGSAYELVKDSCTYGLYKEAAVSFSADGVITLTNFNGANYASLSINDGTDDYTLNDADPADGEWVWDSDDSSSVKTFTLGSNWTSYILGKTITVTVNLQNGTTMESTPVAVPTN